MGLPHRIALYAEQVGLGQGGDVGNEQVEEDKWAPSLGSFYTSMTFLRPSSLLSIGRPRRFASRHALGEVDSLCMVVIDPKSSDGGVISS